MVKIDRLGWAGGICFESYGLRIGVRTNKPEPEVLERIMTCLPPGWKPAAPPFVDMVYSLRIGGISGKIRNYHLLYAPLHHAARTMILDEVFETLENEIQMLVAEYARERVFVHAGVVGWKGQAIVLPGRSMAGKSTLVAALLRAGATYYSDEYAVLDGDGCVHPYPRRLALRQPAGGTRRCTAEELGSRAGTEPLPVATVAIARYRQEGQWRPRRLTEGQAVVELLQHTLPVLKRPNEAITALERVVPRSVNLKGLRGDANATAASLLHTLCI